VVIHSLLRQPTRVNPPVKDKFVIYQPHARRIRFHANPNSTVTSANFFAREAA